MVNYGLLVALALQTLGLGMKLGELNKTKKKKWSNYGATIIAYGLGMVLYFWVAGWTIN